MLIVAQPLQGDLGMEREAGQRIAQLVSRNRQEFIPARNAASASKRASCSAASARCSRSSACRSAISVSSDCAFCCSSAIVAGARSRSGAPHSSRRERPGSARRRRRALVGPRPKVIHGIRAEEREGMPEVGLQVVPEFFQAKTAAGWPSATRRCDHLPEDSHLTLQATPAR